MKWGGKVTLELGKEIVLPKTCPIGNLWISNCWYNSNPEMLSTINEAHLSVTECFSRAVSLMLSGNFGDAKIKWLNICDETAYEGLKKQGHLIDYWGTEVGMSHGPLSSLFERKFKSSCTSPRCAGFKNRSLHGTDLNFIKDSVDLVQKAILLWESGYDNKCPGIFEKEPLDHSLFRRNDNYGTEENPIIKFECSGNIIYEGIAFKIAPPILIFNVLEDLSSRILDLAIVPKKITLHWENFDLGSVTFFCSEGEGHFSAYLFHAKADRFYYFDALANVFSSVPDTLVLDGKPSLMIYFRMKDGPFDEDLLLDDHTTDEKYCRKKRTVSPPILRNLSKIKKHFSDYILSSPTFTDDEDDDFNKAIKISEIETHVDTIIDKEERKEIQTKTNNLHTVINRIHSCNREQQKDLDGTHLFIETNKNDSLEREVEREVIKKKIYTEEK